MEDISSWTDRARSVEMAHVEKYIGNILIKNDSPQMQHICATATEAKIVVELSLSEHHKRTRFIAGRFDRNEVSRGALPRPP